MMALILAVGITVAPQSAEAQSAYFTGYYSGGHCRICGGRQYACSNGHPRAWNQGIHYFRDPTPVGARITDVRYRLYGLYGAGFGTSSTRAKLNGQHFFTFVRGGSPWCNDCDGYYYSNRWNPGGTYRKNTTNYLQLDTYSRIVCLDHVQVEVRYTRPTVRCYRDADGDGRGNPSSSILTYSCTGGWVSNRNDCNDSNRNIYIGAPEVCDNIDNDCDGGIDEGIAHRYYYYDVDNDNYGTNSRIYECRGSGHYTAPRNGDCNDGNANINPGRAEVCNNIDDNCRNGVDEGIPHRYYYYDVDNDNYGTNSRIYECRGSGHYTAPRNGDCNDGNANINPGRTEVCNGVDDNCRDGIDEGVRPRFYRDADGDGYGNPGVSTLSCTRPNNYVTNNRDCNDSNRNISPGAREVCNGVDDDCDRSIDEGTRVTRYRDADGDTWGGTAVSVCPQWGGYVSRGGDCNDGNRNIKPNALEVCDFVDNNCNGRIDEGGSGGRTYRLYPHIQTNVDYGPSGGYWHNSTQSYVYTQNHVNSSYYDLMTWFGINIGSIPDNAVIESATMRMRQRNPYFYNAYGGGSPRVRFLRSTTNAFNSNYRYNQMPRSAVVSNNFGGFNNSSQWWSFPLNVSSIDWNAELQDNWLTLGADDSSSVYRSYIYFYGVAMGSSRPYIDVQVRGTSGTLRVTRYRDGDGDGYGGSTASVCSNTPGYVNQGGDCNDSNRNINPGRAEICGNNIDDNCNGQVDENRIRLYRDADRDGYGTSQTTYQCSVISGWTTRSGDCNDTNANINPGRSEVCNNIDDNCNGTRDEGVTVVRYRDADGDNYGTSRGNVCPNTPGWGQFPGDCNDSNRNVNPGATEVCDFIDNDCDGSTDEGLQRYYYNDVDNDTYGTSRRLSCGPSGTYRATRGGDCNDSRADVNPGAREVCDYVDNDCDGSIDEGLQRYFYYDRDGDTYGTSRRLYCSGTGYYTATRGGDCNDSNNRVNPGATEVCDYLDNDCDGQTDEGLQRYYYYDVDGDTYGTSRRLYCAPTGYYRGTRGGDCNDSNNRVYPGATEVCDYVDNDCDRVVDEGLQRYYYYDVDGDTYGTSRRLYCAPTGYYRGTRGGDCNDSNRNVNPGATEVCDYVDNDCDGITDEGLQRYYYYDRDGDSYGTSRRLYCAPTGYYRGTRGGDCNDSNRNVNPGATEVCDYLDNDCDRVVDEGLQRRYYYDVDNDSYGTGSRVYCAPTGYYRGTRGGDCNDSNANVNPGATEICDFLDNDCDGQTDEGLQRYYYNDRDNDGYGTSRRLLCGPSGTYRATQGNDCNDSNAAINPGATERCNGVDDDCDSAIDEGVRTTYYNDVDGDSYGTSSQALCGPSGTYRATRGGDCNDSNANINPGATEVCDFLDNNCRNGIDEDSNNRPLGLRVTRYRNNDGDGFGAAAASVCSNTPGYTDVGGDCDDTRNFIYPGATELCGNNLDDNCNGQIDENKQRFYRDFDSDGYGNPSNSALFCTRPNTHVADNTDCNDGVATINPGATERCNNIDDNCNSQTDEGNPDSGASCDTGLPGECADVSTTICLEGNVVCGPRNVDDFGTTENVTIPGGLLGRANGVPNGDWKLVTSNGSFLFNLSYGRNGGTRNGYTIKVIDPQNGYNTVKTIQAGTSSDYIDGVNAKGDIVYAIQWTGGNGARVTEINWRTGNIERITTHNQGSTQAIEGQYDWINDVHWLGALRSSSNVYEHRGNEISAASLVRSFPAAGVGGAGTVSSDGRFLYVKRWYTGSYPGTRELIRFGSGYGNTVRGVNYGTVATVNDTLSTTFHPDGYVYIGGNSQNTMQRVKVSKPIVEICGDGLDNNCNGGVDDYCEDEDPFDDFDGGLVRCNWNVTSTHGSATTPTVADGVLKARVTTAVSGQPNYGSGLTSRFSLSGDFDVQVDYDLVGWNANNGIRVNLAAPGYTAHRLNERGGNEQYVVNFGGQIGNRITTTQTSGRLRLTRVGNVYTAYYDDAGWRQFGQRSGGPTGAVPITLSIHGHGTLPANAEVHFDNFVIAKGNLSTPGPLGPEVCDGEDNNCDGEIDEDADVACSTDCEDGVQVCTNGTLGVCTARVPSDTELCDDGIDNNCNGDTDEECGGFNPFDDFEDGNLAACRWRTHEEPTFNQGADAGTRVDEADGVLRTRIARNTRGTSFGTGATTRFGVRGDFDVQVDYVLPSWPSRNHVRAGFMVNAGGTSASIQRTGDRNAGESYVSTVGNSTAGRTATSALTGRLRITRSGNVIRTFFQNGLNNNNWVLNHTQAWNNGDATIALQIWGHDSVSGNVEVNFDNLTFNGCNEAPCRTWPGGSLVSFGGVGTPEGSFDPTTCDGIDNDCDGFTDGFDRACTTACGDGTELCTLGNWGLCSAQAPIAEVCDGEDNDCDGDIDEEDPNEGGFCIVSGQQGVCAQGTKVCRGEQGLVCEGPNPSTEVCDGEDNDCDGIADETGDAPDVFAADTTVGYYSFEERSGSTYRDNAGDNNAGTVNGNARLGRTGRYGNAMELDGTGDFGTVPAEGTELDMDLHTQITMAFWVYPRDRHTPRAYTVYRGGSYYITLLNGRPAFYGYGLSTPGYHTAPSALPLNTWSHVAATWDGSTVRIYVNGNQVHTANTGGAFAADTGPLVFGHASGSPDTGLNGFLDEVIISREAMSPAQIQSILAPPMPGGGVQCDTGDLGVCQQGVSACVNAAFTCSGNRPSPELCDGLDNDCDGSSDEGNPQGGGACLTNNPGVCRTGTFLCDGGALTCDAIQPGQNTEVCDGEDNDCDGSTDETFPGQNTNCSTNQLGACATGELRCVQGGTACVGPRPTPETCDNVDNDCDGDVDEQITRACSTDCGGGTETCRQGVFAGCTARLPTPEICDGEDNDCDGSTDESIVRSCRTDCGGGTQVCNDGNFGTCSAPLPSQEICDGLDNNCNGFIDDSVDCGCQYFPRDEPVQPTLEWMWTGLSGNQTETDASISRHVMMTPIAGPLVDTNNDGRVSAADVPALIFTTTPLNYRMGGTLRALRGDTGQELWSYTDRFVFGGSSPALGDLDDDGVPEVVTYAWRDTVRGAPNDAGLIALDNQGNELWNNTDVNRTGHYELGSPAIANIDKNSPGNEIATCFALIDAQGNTLWDVLDDLPNGSTRRGFCSPVVADIDNDDEMEIVIGARAYNHDGTVAWTNTQLYGQWNAAYDIAPAIADLNDDGTPEVVVVRSSVYVLNGQTGSIMAQHSLPGGGQGGAPNIADFDGDGQPEIGTAGGNAYAVFKMTTVNNTPTLNILWQSQTRDFSSSVTGSSVFDFNGDGTAEVVYNDELYLRIYDGSDGSVIFEQPNWSGTLVEYPLIVDIDNDGNAEIVVGRNRVGNYHDDYNGGWDGTPMAGIRVYGDTNDNWVNTRSIWNQYSYHITNVSDNGSIPVTEEKGWTQRTTNNFRNNFQGDQGLFSAPDLVTSLDGNVVQGPNGGNYPNTQVAYCAAYNRVRLTVCNEGDVPVPAGVEVGLYLGNPDDDLLVATGATTRRLETDNPGNCETITVEWNSEIQGTHELFVKTDFEDDHNECDEENNVRSLGSITLQALTEEKCDNVDNNCNAEADEMLVRECSNICGTGTETCTEGDWQGCSVQPTDEICDGLDNDCNGNVDDGTACPGNQICVEDSVNDAWVCADLLKAGGECSFGCPLGTVCSADQDCVPYCADDNGCPNGEVCGDDNVCYPGDVETGSLDQAIDEEDNEVATPLGACSAGSFAKGTAPAGGLGLLFLLGLGLAVIRRKR